MESFRVKSLTLIFLLIIAVLGVTVLSPTVSASALGPSEYYMSSTFLDGFGSDYRKLATSSQTEENSTRINYDEITGNYTVDPFTTSSTTGTPSSTALKGFGWRTDGVYGAVIPPAIWTFNLTITSNATTANADTGHIEIYAYSCNTTGGDVTSLFTIDAYDVDVLNAQTNKSHSSAIFIFTYTSGSSINLTNLVLVVEYWLEVEKATSGSTATATFTTGKYPGLILLGADMEVTEVSVDANVAIAGVPVNVNVTIKNNGPANGSATVSVYANDTMIQVWRVENLTAGYSNETKKQWDTTAFDNGTYTISAWVRVIAPAIDLITGNNRLEDGDVSIKRYDVALPGEAPVYAYPTGVSAGTPVYINVTVENQGGYSATTTVTPYYGIPPTVPWTAAASGVGVTLDPAETKELKFTWNTGGVADGKYQFKANLTHVTDEYEFADNEWSPPATINIPAVHDVSILSVSKNATNIRLGVAVKILVTIANEGDTPNTETVYVTPYYDSSVAASTQSVVVNARSTTKDSNPTKVLTFIWDTTIIDYGDYTIKAVADQVSGETDTADNTYIDGTVVTPRVYVDPPAYVYNVGETFDVYIKIERCPELYSWEFNITWDPNILKVWGNGGGFTNGSFLSSQVPGDTFFIKDISGVWPTNKGWIYGAETAVGTVEAVGSGTLASLNFTVLQSGQTSIKLENDILVHLGPGPEYEILTYPAEEYSLEHGGFKWPAILGDINKDGIVNIMDLATIAVAYGTTTGDPLYNPDADIATPYGEIDIADLATCALDYGKYA